jgi:peptide/nickel transport system permease protein
MLPLQMSVGLALLIVLLLLLLLPHFITMPPAVGGSILEAHLPPLSAGHPLGTDVNGNDVAARLIYGCRTSLAIAFFATLSSLCIGGGIGILSGYVGGVTDRLVTRLLDILLAFPSLIGFLALAYALQRTTLNAALALSVFSIPAYARVARTSTLRLREQPFMMAAILCGSRTPRILATHVVPNIGPQLLAFAVLGVGGVILIEGAASFLGFGVAPPAPSLGNMIYQGQQSLMATPWLVILPSTALLALVLTFNLLGEALQERWR